MKPTTDIVEELRLYNRWRRGDEAITAPDPTTLGKLLDDAADRIEHLFASGIHTCHADCQRPMCVLRRERDKAHADLARVTAELADELKCKEREQRDFSAICSDRNALRARNSELKAQLDITDAAFRASVKREESLRARVAELVEQLKAYGKYAHDTTLEDRSAESAAPAKQEAAR